MLVLRCSDKKERSVPGAETGQNVVQSADCYGVVTVNIPAPSLGEGALFLFIHRGCQNG